MFKSKTSSFISVLLLCIYAPNLLAASGTQNVMDDYESNMCNQKIISQMIGPISKVFHAKKEDEHYLPKVASHNESHFCTENLDFTCCDSKMLYNVFHNSKFVDGLKKFRNLKGKIMKMFRLFSFIDTLNYETRLQRLLKVEVEGRRLETGGGNSFCLC